MEATLRNSKAGSCTLFATQPAVVGQLKTKRQRGDARVEHRLFRCYCVSLSRSNYKRSIHRRSRDNRNVRSYSVLRMAFTMNDIRKG